MTQKWETNQTTSKIHKPYINGKTKRPRTHQYPYLGPKVVVVAGKLDPTVGQLCFCIILQTVRNLQKGSTGMSSEGPKMVGWRYGSAWSGQKMQKNGDPWWRKLLPSPARFGRVRLRFAVKFHGQNRLTLLLLPDRRVCKVGGLSRLPRLKLERPENGSKRPSLVLTILGSFFSRVSFGTQG